MRSWRSYERLFYVQFTLGFHWERLNFYSQFISYSKQVMLLDIFMVNCPFIPMLLNISKQKLSISNQLQIRNESKHYRSSRPEVFCKKVVLKNFAKFTRKHLFQSLFFNKVAGLRTATLLKKRPWNVNFEKFLRRPIFIEHFWWLLLTLCNLDFIVLQSDKISKQNYFESEKRH